MILITNNHLFCSFQRPCSSCTPEGNNSQDVCPYGGWHVSLACLHCVGVPGYSRLLSWAWQQCFAIVLLLFLLLPQCLSVDHKPASMKANVALCYIVIYRYLSYDTKKQTNLIRPWQLNVWSACRPFRVRFQPATFVACHTCIYPDFLSASWPVIIQ